MASLTLLVASVLASSHGFVVCPDKEVAYFHVPKAAGLHTPATLRIVDRLYARDFELLGYQKIGARMMRLCGQRAARHAAIRGAAAKRGPPRRKKYRGPTWKSASTRNAEKAKEDSEKAKEDFGKHMKQWLEANQVPLLPDE